MAESEPIDSAEPADPSGSADPANSPETADIPDAISAPDAVTPVTPLDPAETINEITSQIDIIIQSVTVFLRSFATPWSLIQFGLIVAAFCLAWLISYLINTPIENRLREIRGRPRLLRFLVVIFRRARWIIFTVALWIIFAILRQGTWPSRSYFILIAAGLVTAWVVISIVSRVIRNRSVAKIIAVATWGLLALYLTSLLGPVTSWLDYAAIEVGTMRLSLLLVVKAFMLLALLLWLASVFGEFIESWLHRNQDLTPRLQVLISKTVKVTLFVLAVFVGLSAVGVDLTALTVFSGAVGLGIGFGLQKIFSNLISGMIILMDKSIKPGDVISLGDKFGWISDLRGRYVSVITRDGWEFLIPNEDFISQQVINWSYSSDLVRLDVDFGVSYDSDPHEIRKLAVQAVKEVDRISLTPAPVCHLKAFGGSSLDFVLRFWIKDPEKGLTNIKGAVFLRLWDTFKENGVDIPYPHLEVIKKEVLQPEIAPPEK